MAVCRTLNLLTRLCYGNISSLRLYGVVVVKPRQIAGPSRFVPDHIARPDYADNSGGILSRMRRPKSLRTRTKIKIKSSKQIEAMRESCRIARRVLESVKAKTLPGVTTDELDRIAHEECVSSGAYPSPLLYKGFPKSICTSVNNVACHGIPDDRALEHGDIINVDVTVSETLNFRCIVLLASILAFSSLFYLRREFLYL